MHAVWDLSMSKAEKIAMRVGVLLAVITQCTILRPFSRRVEPLE